MNFVFFAWLASITYAVGAVIGKLSSKHHIENPWLFNFMWGVIATAILVPVGLLNGMGFPQDWPTMAVLALANVVSGTLYVLAMYEVDVSVIGPLGNLRTPFLVMVGVLLFGERLSAVQGFLIAVIIAGGMLVNVEERFHWKVFVNRRVALVLLWVATSVWFNSYIKYASRFNGYWEVLVWPNILGMLMLLPTIPLFRNDLKRTPVKRYGGLLMMTVLFNIGWVFEVLALRQNISISMAIISLPVSMILAIGFSVVAPKLLEKHTARVYMIRIAAAAIMVAAALGLSR